MAGTLGPLSLITIFTVDCTHAQSITLGSCKDNEFRCADGICIPAIWVCDYEVDCANGEDELADLHGNECLPCQERGYFCHDEHRTTKCIPPQWRCDMWTDCANGIDELYCAPCAAETQFACNDGKCIDNRVVCDGNRDCFFGEDEVHGLQGANCTDAPSVPSPSPLNLVVPSIVTDVLMDTTDTENADFVNHNDEDSEADDSPTWKYCPNDIVWLGFAHTFEHPSNASNVYWIEPKVREQNIRYQVTTSTLKKPGDAFTAGLHTLEYIAKRIQAHNITDLSVTDDPIVCSLRVLVLAGMKDFEISKCESQSTDAYLEWEFVVDDEHYEIAYFSIQNYRADIETARFVPMSNKYHTNCYASIAFDSGILAQNEEAVIIQRAVDWVVEHLWAVIGLIVAFILLFCILTAMLIVLWRKHIEMKHFILADSDDRDDEDDEDEELSQSHVFDAHRDRHEHLTMLRKAQRSSSSTLDIARTAPGGSRRAYASSPHQVMTTSTERSHVGHDDEDPDEEEDSVMMNMETNLDDPAAHARIANDSDTDSTSDEDDNGGTIVLSNYNTKVKTQTRRPSILGITVDELKRIQHINSQQKQDRDAQHLLEKEWDQHSQQSQNL